MGSSPSKSGVLSVVTPPPDRPAKPENLPLATTIMRLCDGDMRKFEYMLFIAAESCRLSYCDVGILHQSLRAYGLSPDVLNAVITYYDNQACPSLLKCKKRNVTERLSQMFKPPESYELTPCSGGFENGGKQPLIRYISSPTDTTCLVINPLAMKPNKYSIIQSTDCIVTFKGSSSIRNWDKNLRAAVSGDLAKEIKSLNLSAPPGIEVSISYVSSLMEIYPNILDAMEKVCPGHKRIFVFGHSKGGAECELAGAMFKLSFPEKEVHIISLGAPKVVNPKSLSEFNEIILNNGSLTRIESTVKGRPDPVTKLPISMTHPGGGESNSLDTLRQVYGYKTANNQRSPQTWPFTDPINWWDPSQKAYVDQKVQSLVAGQKGGDSNYVKVEGYTTNALPLAPHMEYFGIYFWGSQRLPGMGNPAKTSNLQGHSAETSDNTNKIFLANIFEECTKYTYVPWKSRASLLSGIKDTGKMLEESRDTAIAVRKQLIGRSRYTRRKSKRSLKKTRRG